MLDTGGKTCAAVHHVHPEETGRSVHEEIVRKRRQEKGRKGVWRRVQVLAGCSHDEWAAARRCKEQARREKKKEVSSFH